MRLNVAGELLACSQGKHMHSLLKFCVSTGTVCCVCCLANLVYNYRNIAIRKAASVTPQPPRTDVPAYRTNLTTLIGTAKAHTVQLVFMTQQTTWDSPIDPQAQDWHWMRYRDGVTYREDGMDEALESLNDTMRQLAASHGVPIYDLARTLPKSLTFFYDDVHFNVHGARAAGTQLALFLLAQQRLPFVDAHTGGSHS